VALTGPNRQPRTMPRICCPGYGAVGVADGEEVVVTLSTGLRQLTQLTERMRGKESPTSRRRGSKVGGVPEDRCAWLSGAVARC